MPLSVTIPIAEENINLHKKLSKKNNKEEESFIKEVIASLKNSDMSNILNIPNLERVVNDFANIVYNAWTKNSKIVNITKYAKSW